jgi:signal transduction histidine kinase
MDGSGSARVGPQGSSTVWSRALAHERAHPQRADLLGMVVLAAASTQWMVEHTAGGGAAWAFDAGLLVPLVWRRRQPVAVFVVLAAVALVQWSTSGPLLADAALLVAVLTVGSERSFRTAAAAWAVLEFGVVLASVRWDLAGSWIRSLVALSGLAVAAFLFGVALRSRRDSLAELTERAERLELERDQQAQIAVAAERTRIAREMHDVIAHSLAVIISMADGASAKLEREPERAGAAIEAVANVGRQALGETRRLLGVLRDDRDGPVLAPQPGLAQLDGLMAQLRTAGLDASLEVVGDRFEVPSSAELTVYRIVQEAATNTLKHGAGATALAVRVTFDRPRLLVEVADDGSGVVGRPPSGAGHGIAGMRERVTLYGGTLDAGPGHQGGWTVRASLSAVPVGR